MAKDYHYSPDLQRQRRWIWIQFSTCSSRFWTLREYRWRSRIISVKYIQGNSLPMFSKRDFRNLPVKSNSLIYFLSRCRTSNKKQFQPTNHKHSNKFSFNSSLTLLFSSTLPARINSSLHYRNQILRSVKAWIRYCMYHTVWFIQYWCLRDRC